MACSSSLACAQRSNSKARTALPLLILCGTLFPLKIVFTKLAIESGLQIVQLGILGNLAAAFLLLPLLIYQKEPIGIKREHLSVYCTLGFLTFALPTVIANIVVTRVGAGYATSVYCLSPIMTMVLAAIFGIERLIMRRTLAIMFVLVCVIILLHQQFLLIQFDQQIWIVIGLSLPFCAAVANVFRSAFWPEGMSPLSFSFATLVISSVMMLPLLGFMEDASNWSFFKAEIAYTFCAFALITSLSFVCNFYLQAIAGAVYFSQIGSIGTGVGVLMGTLFLGESITILMIVALIGMVIGSQIAKAPNT